jgi:hypothetical protein
LWRRPRPKLGCGAKEREREKSYIISRCCEFNIIFLNVNSQNEDKSDDKKDIFYEELESVLDQFSKYRVKILLGDIRKKGQKIFSNKTGNESLL